MGRTKGTSNITNYHYVIKFQNGSLKYYKTNIDLKKDLDCSYKTIQFFLKRENYKSYKFPEIKVIKKICVPINSIPVI